MKWPTPRRHKAMENVMEREEKMQFAVLIDAENVSARYVQVIFDELEKYGFASCRRIYGNWSKESGWKENILLEYSVTPIQQFSYTSGKNSTDMAMVIDAMDLLYQNKVDGFCLVTSDSDFTRLAMRLREEKKYVLGMGESKTPLALTRACNKFVHLNLINDAGKDNSHVSTSQTGSGGDDSVTSIENVENAILSLLNEVGGEVDLALVGQRLSDKFPDFDVRNYGYSKLSVFLTQELPILRVHRENNNYRVGKMEKVSREKIEKEILSIIQKNGGTVDNLAMINEELKETVMNDLVLLSTIGIHVVLVHGGGPEINKTLERMHMDSQFVDGLRVTDKETAEVVQMVLAGKVNKSLVCQIGNLGGHAIGLCGLDGNMLKCKPVDDVHGYVGEITEINMEIVEEAISKNFIPVISTIGYDENGNCYNINADTVAAAVAGALQAEALISMTDVVGLLRDKDDESSLIHRVYISDTPALIADDLRRGVKKAFIIDGRVPHSILMELLTDEGMGTMFRSR